MKRRESFASAERGDLTLSVLWLMEYTRRTSTMQIGQAHEETDADMLKRALSACRHREGDCGSTQPPRGTARAGERGNVGARKSKVPGGEPGLRLRSCSGSGGSKFLRPGGRECSQLAPGARVRSTGDPRSHQFSQRLIRHGKRRSALFALAVNNQDWFWARNFGAGIEALWRRIIHDPSTFPREFWQLSSCNPTSLPWVKNAATCAWG